MAIRNQKLPFMFEFWPFGAASPAQTYVLPINPEQYEVEYSPQSTLTYTRDGVYEDRSSLVPVRITISGTFGYVGTTVKGHVHHQVGEGKSGWDLYREIEQAMIDFYTQAGADGNGLSGLGELHFLNFTDEGFYEVKLDRFSIKRSTQRRFLYQYTIIMTSKRVLDTPPQEEIDAAAELLASTPEPDTTPSWYTPLLEAYSWANNAMDDVMTQIDAIDSMVQIVKDGVVAFRQKVSDFIDAPFSLVRDAISAIDTVIDTLASFADIPHELTENLKSTKMALLILSRHEDRFRDTGQNASVSSATATGVNEVASAPLPAGYHGSDVAEMDIPELTLFASGSETAAVVGTAETSILFSDTLESIAVRMLGDRSRWRELADLNGLEPPYVVAPGSLAGFSQVLGSGQVVSLPGGAREVVISGLTPSVGQVLAFQGANGIDGRMVEAVSSVSDGVLVEVDDTADFFVGEAVTLHDKTLAVLVAGQKIQVPNTTTAVDFKGDAFYAKAFGTDEYLDDNGNQAADNSGGVQILVGVPNLEMQLAHRFKTPRGELAHLGHGRYGSLIPLFIGKAGDDVWLERIRLEAKICAQEDRRVASVERLVVSVAGTGVLFEGDIIPTGKTGPQRVSILV